VSSYLEGNLNSISNKLNRLVEFRDTLFWFYDAPRSIMEAISVTRSALNDIDLRQKFHKALLMDVIGLYSLSILTLANLVN